MATWKLNVLNDSLMKSRSDRRAGTIGYLSTSKSAMVRRQSSTMVEVLQNHVLWAESNIFVERKQKRYTIAYENRSWFNSLNCHTDSVLLIQFLTRTGASYTRFIVYIVSIYHIISCSRAFFIIAFGRKSTENLNKLLADQEDCKCAIETTILFFLAMLIWI